jgi:hypothetical protein
MIASTIALAASTVFADYGYGVTYGPGQGGFSLGLHEGIQVGGAGNYWRPKPSSDLMSTHKIRLQQTASGCEGGYSGNECTERVCPYGLSSNVSPFLKNGQTSSIHEDDYKYAPTSRMYECILDGSACNEDVFRGDTDKFLGMHTYVECSAQGVCNRETGICDCFDGFSGLGCRYTTCPNDCSGHGLCQQNSVANTDYTTQGASLSFFGSQYWDAYKTMRCVCDRGFSGYDCADRMCPKGDDVLTTCLADESSDIQQIEIFLDGGISSASEKSKWFTLTYIDGFNGVYATSPIPVMDNVLGTAAMTQIALESLPNVALPSVQVSGSETSDTQTLAITFSDATNSGMQNDLACNIRNVDEVCESGQQPFIDTDINAGDMTCTNLGHAETDVSMYEENIECGNRGICDKSTGMCECFEGHTGAACETQSIYV